MGKRNRKAERAARNKRAFDEIIGDPYAYPEPIQGHYAMLKCRSSMAIGQSESKTASPVNQARPNAVDFFCDVEAAIRDGLEVFNREDLAPSPIAKLLDIFDNTYILESGVIFVQVDRAKLEQLIGNILVARHISPAAKYFTTIKK